VEEPRETAYANEEVDVFRWCGDGDDERSFSAANPETPALPASSDTPVRPLRALR